MHTDQHKTDNNEHKNNKNQHKMENNTPKTEGNTPKKRNNGYLTDQELLQKVGILFENIKTQLELRIELTEYGYDDVEIAKGKTLYDKALEEYQKNIREGQEETSAHHLFRQKLDELTSIYATDRKKARIIFKDQPDTLTNLRLRGRTAVSISTVIDDMRVFYSTLQENGALLLPLNRLKINAEHINAQLLKLNEVEKAYANYIREKGENQQATKDKNLAFSNMEKWVREFYAVAKIALEDKPQLLESISKFVRS